MSIDALAGSGPRRAEASASANVTADRVASAGTSAVTDNERTRARLTQLAAEFESMLLLQMLKEMRKSGSWGDDEEASTAGYGKQTMFETIDVELASQLTKAQGFGLARQLLRALDPSAGVSAGAHVSAGVNVSIAARVSAVAKASAVQAIVEPADDAESAAIGMPDGHVTSAFGWRRDPIDGAARFHRGIDIRAAYGQDIQAAGGGRVVSAGTEAGYGETVVIEHAGGLRTRYAHLSALLVTAGQEVTAGQAVGRAGRSGRATGTHLHFEVTTATGDRVDPAVFARFKAGGAAADLTGGISPASAPPELRRGRLSEETR